MGELRRNLKTGVIIASLVAAAWGCFTGFVYWFNHGGLTTQPTVIFVRKYVPGFMLAHQGDPVSKHIMAESVWASFIWGSLWFLVVFLGGMAAVRAYSRRRDQA